MRKKTGTEYTPKQQELLNTIKQKGFYPSYLATIKFSCNTIAALIKMGKVRRAIDANGAVGLELTEDYLANSQ